MILIPIVILVAGFTSVVYSHYEESKAESKGGRKSMMTL